MAIVAGVDFGTLSVRATLVDDGKGPLGLGTAEYPLRRKREDPDHASQSHADHLEALTLAMKRALASAGIDGADVAALAVDTTGSTVVMVDEALRPLGDYYLWCDHRAKAEAERITEVAKAENLEALRWCGGAYSSEFGLAKLLHWLRHNPDGRGRFATALEHCDMMVATLTGVTHVSQIRRSVCAMGHKWMWNPRWGGLPPQDFLSKVDPLLDGIRDRLGGLYGTSDTVAGRLSEKWAARLGLKPGIPVPIGALDAHWDAIGAGCRIGDAVNVVGTSTCVMAIGPDVPPIQGVSGVVPGSIHPSLVGIEAGLSATGDMFEAIARRAGTSIRALSEGLERYRPGETGLLRLAWDNGDRNVLSRPDLGGITLGWNLLHTAQDELFAAIEGAAFHTRIILERMMEGGVPVKRVVNAGGIPQNNPVLNQVYANVLGRPVLVPDGLPTGLGSSIFASLAAGSYPDVESAQDAICRPYRVFEPDPAARAVYEPLYGLFRTLYFGFGGAAAPAALGHVLPELKRLARPRS
ncbi:ribulokinase [Microvirga thermotolerans]|uniref:Ribulokinase n=1 Tax=Microvirga thermotolerans TaxID=2651334 RepID=A0A5P9JYI3_9HYPH|nr:ribulokinase [Microvirga thermotolerans]QFU17191.1 ribulokinase [Microvirga thermotolerans]